MLIGTKIEIIVGAKFEYIFVREFMHARCSAQLSKEPAARDRVDNFTRWASQGQPEIVQRGQSLDPVSVVMVTRSVTGIRCFYFIHLHELRQNHTTLVMKPAGVNGPGQAAAAADKREQESREKHACSEDFLPDLKEIGGNGFRRSSVSWKEMSVAKRSRGRG